MSHHDASAFEGRFSALLFDMDGTLISSIKAAERVWGAWARRQGLDVETFLPTIHGARSVDTITRLGLPGLDPVAEADAITQAEIVDVDGTVEITAAKRFLAALPADKWAIVTSAPLALAKARLKAAGIPLPAVLVSAEDVAIGKPNPACYLLAAQKLGVAIADCLVFEDAPVGIQAAEAAGSQLVIITATHTHPITTRHTALENYEALAIKLDPDGAIRLTTKA